MDKVLIIVPAYNEQDVIERTVTELQQFSNANPIFDYLVIDDGSTDNTRKILKNISANFISHPINLGIGEPFKTGIRFGLEHGYTRFVNFDADGQHRLESLQLMVDCQEDYIVGSRFVSKSKPHSFRMFGSSILSLAIKLKTRHYIADPTSGLLLLNNIEISNFFVSQASNRPEPSLYPKLVADFSIKEVQVEMNERDGGDSYFNLYSSVHFMLEQIFLIILKG